MVIVFSWHLKHAHRLQVWNNFENVVEARNLLISKMLQPVLHCKNGLLKVRHGMPNFRRLLHGYVVMCFEVLPYNIFSDDVFLIMSIYIFLLIYCFTALYSTVLYIPCF